MSGRQRRTFEVGPKTKITGTLVEFGADPNDNDADADGDVPMDEAAPPPRKEETIAKPFKEDPTKKEIENLKFFLQFMSNVTVPGQDDTKFIYDPSQQYSPRAAFAALKAIAAYVVRVQNESSWPRKIRENMSPNLAAVLDVVNSFRARADFALQRGAIRDSKSEAQINVDALKINTSNSPENNTIEYPLKNKLEEFGLIRVPRRGRSDIFRVVTKEVFLQTSDELRESLVNWEVDLVENPRNMIDVKAIFDQILNADERVETYESTMSEKIERYSTLEPPFYPRLSTLEMQTILRWQNALEEVRKNMLKDPLYEFAVMTAGLLNKGINGVEQLLSNKNNNTFLGSLASIPSSPEKNATLKSERDRLYRLKYQIEDELEKQRMSDVIQEQRRLNGIQDFAKKGSDTQVAINERWAANITDFVVKNRALDSEIPDRNKIIATRESTPISVETRRLMQARDVIDDMIKGVVTENSRSRMFHALEWLQKVEILEKAEITPIFKAGLEMSMASIRMLGCNLKTVPSFMNFVESPDPTVRSYFAQLVALEIADIGNVHPKKNYLDKRYKQVNNRKTRLLEAFDTFSFRGGQIVSDSGGNRSVTMNPAYYAFRG